MSEFLEQFWSVGVIAELTIPVYLLARRLPPRPHTLLRSLAVAAGLLALAIIPLATGVVTGLYANQAFVVFSSLLAIYALCIMFIWEADFSQAMFCATAGYTLQNLASGVSLLAQSVVQHHPVIDRAGPLSSLSGLVIPLVVYVLGYFLLARQVQKGNLLVGKNHLMLLSFVAVVVIIIGFDLIIKSLIMVGIPFRLMILLRCVHAFICVFVLVAEYEILVAKHMSEERVAVERVLAERERQYRLSRENIDAINIKCHDIRHQIRHLGDGGAAVDQSVLADIAREVSVYDSSVETGNEALDTILTEKGLTCSSEGITLSIIADGSALGFVSPSDLYSLFGNMLDNAIEAVRGVEEPDRRTINLTVQRRNAMVAINMENYCAVTPLFSDGTPVTTKPDRANHGFGVRSMKAIVTRYGGTFHTGYEDGIFYLNILLAAE